MEISRDGHRARMRAAYLQGGGDAMPDHQLLELLLSISIPRKDVKPIAYALINRFGSLEQVFAAGAADLQQVPGVGEQTAVQILLVRDLNRRIRQNQNKPVKHLTDATQSCAYFANLLRDKTAEQVYLVTLDGSAKILQTHAVGSGSVNLGRCGSAHFDGTYSARQRQRCYAGTQPSRRQGPALCAGSGIHHSSAFHSAFHSCAAAGSYYRQSYRHLLHAQRPGVRQLLHRQITQCTKGTAVWHRGSFFHHDFYLHFFNRRRLKSPSSKNSTLPKAGTSASSSLLPVPPSTSATKGSAHPAIPKSHSGTAP